MSEMQAVTLPTTPLLLAWLIKVFFLTNITMWFRLRQTIFTHEHHSRALRVPLGDVERQVLRTCLWSVLWARYQRSGKRRYLCWEDVVQSEREVTVSAQSQVSATVSTVSQRTRQLWTATCQQRHHWPTTRFVDSYPGQLQYSLYISWHIFICCIYKVSGWVDHFCNVLSLT